MLLDAMQAKCIAFPVLQLTLVFKIDIGNVNCTIGDVCKLSESYVMEFLWIFYCTFGTCGEQHSHAYTRSQTYFWTWAYS